MEKDQKNYCESLYKKWKKLKQDIDLDHLALLTGGEYSEGDDIPGELKEYLRITDELKKECKDFLTSKQVLEIEEGNNLP